MPARRPGPGATSGHGRRRALPWLALLAAALLAGGVVAALGSGGGEEGTGDRGSNGQASSSGSASTEKKAKPKKQQKESTAPAPQATEPAPAPTTPADTSSGDNPVALNDQGFALSTRGDFAAAVPLLDRSVKAFRAQDRKDEMAYAFALYNLGQALNKTDRPAEAIPYLEERLQVSDFKRDVVRFELAAARGDAGRPAGGDGGD